MMVSLNNLIRLQPTSVWVAVKEQLSLSNFVVNDYLIVKQSFLHFVPLNSIKSVNQTFLVFDSLNNRKFLVFFLFQVELSPFLVGWVFCRALFGSVVGIGEYFELLFFKLLKLIFIMVISVF